MKRVFLIVVAGVCLAGAAQAHLGETERECEARYGKPTPSTPTTLGSDKTLVYWKDGVRIAGEFVKGRCLRITYSGRDLTQEVIDSLLRSNSQGSSWIHYKGGSSNDFVRADGLATTKTDPARLPGSGGSVVFTLVQWQNAHDKAIKDAKAAEQAAEEQRIKKLRQDF